MVNLNEIGDIALRLYETLAAAVIYLSAFVFCPR